MREGETAYEERITLWLASNAESAIGMAEEEAYDYAEIVDMEYVGYASAYWMPEPPGHGEEAFSLIRRSMLDAEDYVDRFFDTGEEITGNLGGDGE